MVSVIAKIGDKELEFDNVISIDQPLGDVEPIYNQCGYSLLGFALCPDCRPDGPGCGKTFVETVLRSKPGMCTLYLKDGSQIQVKEFEVVSI